MNRSYLASPFLNSLPAWSEFIQATDALISGNYDPAIDALTKIREIIDFSNLNFKGANLPTIEQAQELPTILQADYPNVELILLILSTFGLNVQSNPFISNLTPNQLGFLAYFLGYYYNQNGNNNFINFFSFVLDQIFSVTALWTQDYVNFYPAGSPEIGVPIWENGPWYPTSKVILTVDLNAIGNSGSNKSTEINQFFNTIAPAHLTLYAIYYAAIANFSQFNWDITAGVYIQLQDYQQILINLSTNLNISFPAYIKITEYSSSPVSVYLQIPATLPIVATGITTIVL